MVEKLYNENVRKQDLELILEVNKKAIQIETEVVEQNEEVLKALSEIQKIQDDHDKKLDKLVKQSDETNRDLFKIQILFISGLLSLVVQIIEVFRK